MYSTLCKDMILNYTLAISVVFTYWYIYWNTTILWCFIFIYLFICLFVCLYTFINCYISVRNIFMKKKKSQLFMSSNWSLTVDPLSYFSFPPVLHSWYNIGQGMWNGDYRRSLAAKQKESFTICLMLYNRKWNYGIHSIPNGLMTRINQDQP